MKKIIAFLLIICMALPTVAFSQEAESTETNEAVVYIFGDDWAKMWGEELSQFLTEGARVVNCAENGGLLSSVPKKAEYLLADGNDVVIISFGILEKDRKGDNNAQFKKDLESIAKHFSQKGTKVIFASICSTMRYNSLTGQMEQTKNYYTETTRSYASANNITYVDLSALTAKWANKLGSGNAGKLYSSALSLTDTGNKMCAYEVFEALLTADALKGRLKNSLSVVYTVPAGTYYKSFDVFYQEEKCDSFAVYIKNGVNVQVNSSPAQNGDSVVLCNSIQGKIDVTFTSCEKIQVAPVYEFKAGGQSTGEAPFTGKIIPSVYDVTVQKTEPLKASVYLNSYLIASNLDMPGTQSVTEAAVHTFTEYHLEEENFSVTVTGLTDKLEYISFRESSIIYEEKPKIFLGGDSTVCNYYPLLRTGEEIDGTVMTGWGMMLRKYVDAEVVNLAASGDWAANWLEKSFPIVEKEGKKGDIFVVQFGINDHDKSTLEEMTSALGEMIDRCAAKGIIPILVSPQISAGYGWGDESDSGKSSGGDYEAFFTAVRVLSEEKGTFYVDLTDLSAGWFSEVGREGVYKKYHLWDYENNKPKDMMHLSYKGADAMCRFFVLGIERIIQSEQTDKWGNSLSALKIW